MRLTCNNIMKEIFEGCIIGGIIGDAWGSSYEFENESLKSSKPSVLVLGSGPIRIGQGVEFDYATVHCVKAIQKAGIKTPADKPIGMHTFRHSIASSMLANGAKLTEIAQTLGHATPESTQTYISVDVELLRQCALEVTL